MNFTIFDPILRQSYLHVISYGLVLSILWVAVSDAYLIWHIGKALRLEGPRLREGDFVQDDLIAMIHPGAGVLHRLFDSSSRAHEAALRRKAELAEAALFVPLRARMTLTRDLSTLMGLIGTLLALVVAASDFSRHGKPELLIGSVGTGCVATCVAAVSCALALCNLSRLMRLRLRIACETEEVLIKACDDLEAGDEIPIQHVNPRTKMLALHAEP